MNLSTTLKRQITKENKCSFRKETVDIFGVKKDAKRSFLCKDRRDVVVLQSTLGDLRRNSEMRIRQYEDDKRNLQWVLYNLQLEKTGLTPSESIIAGETHNMASLRGMQAKSDCQQIKSIRRPLAPESTRDHGSWPSAQSSLQSMQGAVIPREIKREIRRRQSEAKRNEQLEGDKPREMHLEGESVEMFTRINMIKGSLNYKGKPIKSIEEGRIDDPSQTSINQFTSPVIDKMNKHDGKRYKKDISNNVRTQEAAPARKDKAVEVPRNIHRRRNVKGAFVSPKGENKALQARKENDKCTSRDSSAVENMKKELETFGDLVAFSCKELEENRKDVLRKNSVEFVTVEEISNEANHVQPWGNNLETAKNTTGFSSGISMGGDSAKTFVEAVKNKVILPMRLQRQTRGGKRNNLDATHHRRRSYTESEKGGKELITECEEESVATKAKVTTLNAGQLQQLIRENVLSQTQTKSLPANHKIVMLADYLRTLQKHMATTEIIVPENNSPDFSETPFIASGRKLGSEDDQGEEPRTAM